MPIKAGLLIGLISPLHLLGQALNNKLCTSFFFSNRQYTWYRRDLHNLRTLWGCGQRWCRWGSQTYLLWGWGSVICHIRIRSFCWVCLASI